MIARISSLISSYANRKPSPFIAQNDDRIAYNYFESIGSKFTGVLAGAKKKLTIIRFTAVLDPVSEKTQKIVSILNVILMF